VILAFNLEDRAVEREFEITPEEWNMLEGRARVAGGKLMEGKPRQTVGVTIGPMDVTLVDLSVG
jgi:hypothetical protein